MQLINVMLFVLSGGLVGFTLGLIGGGGSILATPLLLYVVGLDAHKAIGTSALAVSVNAFIDLLEHARKQHVRWKVALIFTFFGVLGDALGSSFGKAVDGKKLLFLFAILMVVVGVHMLRQPPKGSVDTTANALHAKAVATIAAIAFVVGILAGFFGIGGGFLIVPGLLFSTGMPMIFAIGSSLLAVSLFGLTTAMNYALSGQVDWVVAVEFIIGGLVGGLLGTALASVLARHKNTLNQIFAGLIFVVAIYMLYKNAHAFF